MLPTVVCLAHSEDHARRMIERLQAEGVPVSHVTLLRQRTAQEAAAAPSTASDPAPGDPSAQAETGAQTGAAAGAAVAATSLAVPGLQPLIVTAPLAAAAGAVIGALFGAGHAMSELSEFGITEAEHDVYQRKIEAGAWLLAVRTEEEDELARAGAVFEEQQGENVAVFRLTKKLT